MSGALLAQVPSPRRIHPAIGQGVLLLLASGGLVALTRYGSGFAVQLTTQVFVLWAFGLSYQVLFGRTGMLSFGHAVNFGLAAFATAHAVRAIPGELPVYELLPFVGAGAGLLCGIVLGYPVTRRSGVAFAMVTLGLGELVAACFLMFPGFFGGEEGVTLQRTRIASLLGADYGRPDAQLLLTAGWTLALLAAVRWLARTPFGIAALAVRENPERVEFLGFRASNVRWVSCIVASTLAGIAGSLSALAYEIVTVDAVSLHTSANVLLMTVIGGAASVAGPLVGATFLTVMQSVLSEWTRAWLFYYGFVFVVLVWLAPEGVTGLWLAVRRRRPGLSVLAATVAKVLGVSAAMVVFIESAYQLSIGEPAQLPGWEAMSPAALLALLWASGVALAIWLAQGLRRVEVAR